MIMNRKNNCFKICNLSDLEGKINKDILQQIRTQHKRAEVEDQDYLTDLQKVVFSYDDFWEKGKNVIIRGRTSSGKTMIAEIATAYFGIQESLDSEFEMNKIIYLVPLRAMVAEKLEEFKEIFEKSLKWKVYASSSDYQDHDEDIIQGKFKIAVIVYEKFFALLAQNNNFVSQCSLIVVDELQMLGVEDRGAKLEVALTKINIINSKCKVLALTTLQCETLYIKNWLNASEIECSHRPKSLYEYIVWPELVQTTSQPKNTNDNQYNFCYYLNVEPENDNNTSHSYLEHSDGKILFDKVIKPDFKKNNCEKSMVPDLVDCILNENENKKILIFINNKNSVEKLAKDLGDYFSKNKTNSKKIINPNDERIFDIKSSGEDDVDTFLDEILPYGVAYHHGGLSRTMRDFVEEEFRKSNGYINIVVATETLAIGVNMPADVVILVGVNLPRGNNRNNVMKSSEYKNCIGRAGRLGINSEEYGSSYLIATSQAQANDYWEKYVNAKPVNIMSYMLNLSDEQKSPFMLNLVQCNERALGGSGNNFELKEYGRAANKSFFHYCTEINRKLLIESDPIILPTEDSEMYQKQLNALKSVEMLEEDDSNFETTLLGNILAKYALSLSTVKIISNIQKRVFDYLENKTEFFEINNSEESLTKSSHTQQIFLNYFETYFLDILFDLCNAIEACKGVDDNLDNVYTNSAMIYLKNNSQKLLSDGKLSKILEKYKSQHMELPNQNKSKALKNAILLYEWSQGKNIETIRKNTGLQYAKVGDVDRLGDVIAYLWEAMSYSFQRFGNLNSCVGRLAKMAGTIKYGVPSNIILLASRHLPYISREQLMKIRKEAESSKIDPISYVRNSKNVKKTSISHSRFLALSKALQTYYLGDNQNTDNAFLYKKDLISFEARKVLDFFDDNGFLNVEDLVNLLSNHQDYFRIIRHNNYVEIESAYENSKIIVFPFNKEINDGWIKSTYNEIEKIEKKSKTKTYFILLVCEGVESYNNNLVQFTYDVFIKLYKECLQKIGNVNSFFNVLKIKCDLIDESLVEKIVDMYVEEEITDELQNKVYEYILEQNKQATIIHGDLSLVDSNVTISKSNIRNMDIQEN